MNRHYSSFPRGFTITETVVASAILLLSLTTLYQGLLSSYRSTRKARLEVQAACAAADQYESAMAAKYSGADGVQNYCVTDSLNMTYTMTVTSITNASVANNAKLITLDVGWWFDNQKRTNRYYMLKPASIDLSSNGSNSPFGTVAI